MSRYWLVFLILAVTQITGWGAVSLLPVTASQIAADLGTTLPVVFLGSTVMFAIMGIASPFVGPLAIRFGSRSLMAVGAAGIGCGLWGLSLSGSIVTYMLAWSVVGLAGAMFLTTTAYIYVADFAGKDSRALISTLMLVTGLAGSVFWPLTAYLGGEFGWRVVAQIYAGVMLLAACLLHFALPRVSGSARSEADKARRPLRGPVFRLLIACIALNSFVTFGVEAIGIELFRAMGMEAVYAVAIASALGAFKVMGRAFDVFGGRNWDAVTTGSVAAAVIPVGLLLPALFGAAPLSVGGYLVLFGIGSGAFAVARATMPLVFYDKANYALTMTAIALPLNLASATAAPLLSALLVETGPYAVLAILAGLTGIAFLLVLGLARFRTAAP